MFMAARLYCIYQTFLIAWAFGITVDAIIPCFMADASVTVSIL